MSWDELEALKDSGVAQAHNPDDELFAALFGTELGQKVLDLMRQDTECNTTMPSHAADGVAMGMLMALREGENNYYRRICLRVKRGSQKRIVAQE